MQKVYTMSKKAIQLQNDHLLFQQLMKTEVFTNNFPATGH